MFLYDFERSVLCRLKPLSRGHWAPLNPSRTPQDPPQDPPKTSPRPSPRPSKRKAATQNSHKAFTNDMRSLSNLQVDVALSFQRDHFQLFKIGAWYMKAAFQTNNPTIPK